VRGRDIGRAVRPRGRRRGSAHALLLAIGALGGGGCTVGSGAGSARGPIFLLGCGQNGEDLGSFAAPVTFDLAPHFFAGEPIEDVAVGTPDNRLLIRMQRNGNRVEVNDTLYFDVQNTYDVARCVRGQTVNGAPQYDPTWCDWSGGATVDGGALVDGAASDGGGAGGPGDGGADADDGGDAGTIAPATPRARIRIGTEAVIRSSLSLLFTCHNANVVDVAVDGWIDFLDFGSAAQPDRPPELRDPVDPKFTVNFGQRLRANFEVQLADQRVTTAIKNMDTVPAPVTGGSLDGNFDFDLERGRAAQPFP
jgi:hypothetical protein